MTRFVQLTHVRTERPGWVNLDLVQSMRRMGPAQATTYSPELPERTLVVFGPPTQGDPFSNAVEVLETPEQILSAADPDQCPDPANCSYRNHYLVYGPAELTHGGWHAAERIGAQHFKECRVYESGRVCSTCSNWEARLRA